MRRIALLCVATLACSRADKPTSDVNDLEAVVQIAALDSMFHPDNSHPLSVLVSPGVASEGDSLSPEELAGFAPGIEPSTAEGFFAALRDSSPLPPSLHKQADLRWISDSSFELLLTSRHGLRDGPSLPKGGPGIAQVSHVGFNAARTQALVDVSHLCGGLCGQGDYFLLARSTDGRWRVVARQNHWQS